MQAQFICYKLKFVNLELRHKLARILIRLSKTTKIKSSQSTQHNHTQGIAFLILLDWRKSWILLN